MRGGMSWRFIKRYILMCMEPALGFVGWLYNLFRNGSMHFGYTHFCGLYIEARLRSWGVLGSTDASRETECTDAGPEPLFPTFSTSRFCFCFSFVPNPSNVHISRFESFLHTNYLIRWMGGVSRPILSISHISKG